MSRARKTYEVGYGRPPAETRFKPGQSGNPRGRPKGAKSISAIFKEELARKIPVTQFGRTRMMQKGRVAILQQIDKAVKGDERSLALVLKFAGAEEASVSFRQDKADANEITHDDYDEILKNFIADIKAGDVGKNES